MGKFVHGYSRRNRKTREYRTWEAMHRRCNNPSQINYADYGGREITVCERWSSFELFLQDMGSQPEGTTLDRVETDGPYEPGNCKWSTRIEQARNKRNNAVLQFGGRSQCLSAWAEEIGMKQKTLRARIFDHGMSVEDALTKPLRGKMGTNWAHGAPVSVDTRSISEPLSLAG